MSPTSLGQMVREYRRKLRPEYFGLEPGGRRSAGGLSRAQLARVLGISLRQLTRIEQDRVGVISSELARAMAHEFRLSDAEREVLGRHVHTTAGPALRKAANYRQSWLQDLERTDWAWFLIDGWLDIAAWSRQAHQLLAGHLPFNSEPGVPVANLANLLFLDSHVAAMVSPWEVWADAAAAHLRATTQAARPGHRGRQLLGELHIGSEAFRQRWRNPPPSAGFSTEVKVKHPLVGEIDVQVGMVPVMVSERSPQGPEHLVLLAPPTGSPSADAWELLARQSIDAKSS